MKHISGLGKQSEKSQDGGNCIIAQIEHSINVNILTAASGELFRAPVNYLGN